MTEQFTGARRVSVTATVTFDAYLMPADETTATPEALAERIGDEVADVVATRLGWTTDAEPGDLVVVVTGGMFEPNPPRVYVSDVVVSEPTDADPAAVAAQAAAVASERG